MGQSFKVVNLDKAEYLCPTDVGGGSKLCECWGGAAFMARASSTEDGKRGEYWQGFLDIVAHLLSQGFRPDEGLMPGEFLGRWAEDRIVIIGDYHVSGLYGRLDGPEYRNIGQLVHDYFVKKYSESE